jgi:hypothetical protein
MMIYVYIHICGPTKTGVVQMVMRGGAKIPNGIATELIQCVLLKFSSMKLFAGQLNSHLAPSVLHEESLKV